jgi:HSP20 family molecular chaperone IbpA
MKTLSLDARAYFRGLGLTDKEIDETIFNFETKNQDKVTEPKEAPRYPLTNLSTDADENLYIEIATAGFSKEMLEIELIEGFGLHVNGIWVPEDLDEDYTYHQKHISQRDFVRKIALDEVYLDGEIHSSYNDGMLTIMILPKVVEEVNTDRKIIPIG